MVCMIIYFDCMLCIIDLITISAARRFLFDFLIQQRNRKSVRKLHAKQQLKDRITLSYIVPLLTKNTSVCILYQKIYMIIIYTLVPQYIILLICNSLMKIKSLYVLIVFASIKLVVAIIIRLHTNANLVSRYREK